MTFHALPYFWGVQAALSHPSISSCARAQVGPHQGRAAPAAADSPPVGQAGAAQTPSRGRKGSPVHRSPRPQGCETTVSKPLSPGHPGEGTLAQRPSPEEQPSPGAPHQAPHCEAYMRELSVGPHWLGADPLPPSPTTERAGSDPVQPPLPDNRSRKGPLAAGPGGAPRLCCLGHLSCAAWRDEGEGRSVFQPGNHGLWPATPGPPRAPPRHRAPPPGLDSQPEARPPARICWVCGEARRPRAGPSLVHWPGPWKPLGPHRSQC